MADGATYPVRITDANGHTAEGNSITYTNSANQPSTVPFVADATIATDSTGAHNLITVDVLGPKMLSPSGTLAVEVLDSGLAFIGAADFGQPVEFEGAVTLDAAVAAATQAIASGQVSSRFTIASGTLPNLGSWVSGTGKQNPTSGGVARQITVNVETVTDGTNNAATNAIAVSADNSTYTTVGTPGASAPVNNLGAVTTLSCVTVPAGWYIKCTFSHATVAASIYY